jgi:mannose-6-phosphate isomerase-like protein (cupin superfamily)
MDIAKIIRELRRDKKLTLRQLSQASGVALATLSRIETGKMTGTVESHGLIASALGMTLSQMYANLDKNNGPIEYQSRNNRTDMFHHNNKASYHMLTSNVLSKKMMPVILSVAQGGATSPEKSAKEAEKFIYVLKGEITVFVDEKKYSLKKSETLYFDASLSHCIKNTGKEDAQAVCVTTPPEL